MQPIFRRVDPKCHSLEPAWGFLQRAGLRSTLANRQWTQDRLHVARLAPSPVCQLCSAAVQWSTAEGDRAYRHPLLRGALLHWHWECPVAAPWRKHTAPPDPLRELDAAKDCHLENTATWMRGLVLLIVKIVPQPLEEASFTWGLRIDDKCITGVV